VQAIMDELGGRPHWGKRHFQTAATLQAHYPDWERFQTVRARLDPHGRFANDYTDRVLGPVVPASAVSGTGARYDVAFGGAKPDGHAANPVAPESEGDR
jgi:L-gulonolactone oxidase